MNIIVKCIHWDDYMCFFSSLLRWLITLIGFLLFNQPCICVLDLTWSWCIILLICCWIQLTSIWLRILQSSLALVSRQWWTHILFPTYSFIFLFSGIVHVEWILFQLSEELRSIALGKEEGLVLDFLFQILNQAYQQFCAIKGNNNWNPRMEIIQH